MIVIKTLSRNTSTNISAAGDLIWYIDDGDPHEYNRFTHNLKFESPEFAIRQMTRNDLYRIARKNGVSVYHEVASVKKGSTEISVTDFIQYLYTYIYKRCPNAYVFGKIHETATDCLHAHLCIAGTEIESSQITGLELNDYKRIRIEMDEFLRDDMGIDESELVYLSKTRQPYNQSKTDKNKRKQDAIARSKRLETEGNVQVEEKEKLTALALKLCKQTLAQGKGKEHFIKLWKENGYEIALRNGNPNGIFSPSGRKYRYTTLIDKGLLEQLENTKEKTNGIELDR